MPMLTCPNEAAAAASRNSARNNERIRKITLMSRFLLLNHALPVCIELALRGQLGGDKLMISGMRWMEKRPEHPDPWIHGPLAANVRYRPCPMFGNSASERFLDVSSASRTCTSYYNLLVREPR